MTNYLEISGSDGEAEMKRKEKRLERLCLILAHKDVDIEAVWGNMICILQFKVNFLKTHFERN
jgi:hypothetical protein